MKIINMLKVEVSPPEPHLSYPKPNPYEDHYFDACLFDKITVSNDLTGNPLSLTQK